MNENTYIQSILNYIGIATDKKNHNEIIINFPILYIKKYQEYRINDYKITTQPIGTFFSDFINCDFNNKDELLNFFNKYSLSLCDMSKFKKLFKDNVCKENVYNDFIDKIIYSKQKQLTKIQEQLDMVLDFSLINPPNKVKKLSPIERLFLLERTNEALTILRANKLEHFCLHYFSKDPGQGETEIINALQTKKTAIASIEILIPHSIESIIYMQLCDILEENIFFKTCKCCNKYFIAENNKYEYCNNKAPNSNKTCREIGRKKSYYNNINNDDVLKLYNKVYYRKATMANRYPDIKKYTDEYEHFKNIGKKKISKYKSGEISSDEFKQWINKNK